jgi:hypothetical protein
MLHNWTEFKKEFELVYFDQNEYQTTVRKLQNLTQTAACSAYSTDFQNYIDILGWTDDKQIMVEYRRGLKDNVKDMLVNAREPRDWQDLGTLAINADNHLWERRQEKGLSNTDKPKAPAPKVVFVNPIPAPPPVNTGAQEPIPMDLSAGRSNVFMTERTRRMQLNLCLYCGQAGHRKDAHRINGRWVPNISGTKGAEAVVAAGEAEPVKDDSL